MTVAQTIAFPANHRWSLSSVVLGRGVTQRRAVKRLLLVSHAYAVIWAITGFSVVYGYSPPAAWWLIVYGVIGQSFFYVALRRGWTVHMTDPLCCYPQLLFGIGACVIGYALIPYGQGPALQVLVVLFIYDLHRLTPRQIGTASALAVVLLSLTALLMWARQGENFDLFLQATNIGVAICVIPMVSIVGRGVRRVHMAQLDQKAQLDEALLHLQTLSQRDALTGVFNRRHGMTLLAAQAQQQQQDSFPFCIAMVDIDHFKRINDGFGHAVGDAVLQQLTQLVQAHLRHDDMVSRWGGEEFLILMPNTHEATALQVLETLREHVENSDWQQRAHGLQVSFSAGVAEHLADHRIERTIERADTALYQAKTLGRNRVQHAG